MTLHNILVEFSVTKDVLYHKEVPHSVSQGSMSFVQGTYVDGQPKPHTPLELKFDHSHSSKHLQQLKKQNYLWVT
ncbi:hypothetical protein CDAR_170311 [Caerostris darwini]|uniref:Uncharacterized protein n=1 Tax=Caerostris darwini TaxID=1538125 RepID=A0AAV4VJZ2_9ARAC|nr:hypothetical protein CDAR_170311 [Caerostris darwini]